MEEEPGSSGKIATDFYRRHLLLGYACRPDPATGPKEVRANPLATYAEGGLVKLYKGLWNEPWLSEISIFPEGENDDQVDSAAGAFNKVVGKGLGTAQLMRQKNFLGKVK